MDRQGVADRTEQIGIRLSPREIAAIDSASAEAGLGRTEWCRIVLAHAAGLDALAKVLRTAGRVGRAHR